MQFEFWLADRLRMTVARLREEMTQREFVMWNRFHVARTMTEEMEQAAAEAKMRRG